MGKSTKQTKLPAQLPEWRAKAIWRATSVILKVRGKDEADAKDRAWKKVARTEGGDACYEVKILGKVN